MDQYAGLFMGLIGLAAFANVCIAAAQNERMLRRDARKRKRNKELNG